MRELPAPHEMIQLNGRVIVVTMQSLGRRLTNLVTHCSLPFFNFIFITQRNKHLIMHDVIPLTL